jgi:hypothetical protein
VAGALPLSLVLAVALVDIMSAVGGGLLAAKERKPLLFGSLLDQWDHRRLSVGGGLLAAKERKPLKRLLLASSTHEEELSGGERVFQ